MDELGVNALHNTTKFFHHVVRGEIIDLTHENSNPDFATYDRQLENDISFAPTFHFGFKIGLSFNR